MSLLSRHRPAWTCRRRRRCVWVVSLKLAPSAVLPRGSEEQKMRKAEKQEGRVYAPGESGAEVDADDEAVIGRHELPGRLPHGAVDGLGGGGRGVVGEVIPTRLIPRARPRRPNR